MLKGEERFRARRKGVGHGSRRNLNSPTLAVHEYAADVLGIGVESGLLSPWLFYCLAALPVEQQL